MGKRHRWLSWDERKKDIINLFPTVSQAPNAGRLTRRMRGTRHTVVLWSRICSSHIVKIHGWIMKEKMQAEKPMPGFLTLSLFWGNAHEHAPFSSNEQCNPTCNVASQGPQQGFRSQGFYRGMVTQAPSSSIYCYSTFPEAGACSVQSHCANSLGPPSSLREWDKSEFQMPATGQACKLILLKKAEGLLFHSFCNTYHPPEGGKLWRWTD